MENEIKKATTPQNIWDKEVKGLHVRVFGSGKKAFYLRYKTKSNQNRRPKIGDYPTFSVKDAREVARKILLKVAVGEDPKADWDFTKEHNQNLQSVFELAYAQNWLTQRYIDSGYAKEVQMHYDNHFKKQLGTKLIAELRVRDIRLWHKAIGAKSKTTANRCLSILSLIYKTAIENELVEINYCTFIKRFTEKKRERYATKEELKSIHNCLQKYKGSHPREVFFIYCLLFSGARPSSIERAKCSQLQISEDGCGLLTIKGKTYESTGQKDVILLPSQIMHMASKNTKIDSNDSLTGIKIPTVFWRKIRKEIGCTDLWLRDLRRTFATVGMSNGVNSGTIGELLNHQSIQTTKRYAKLDTSGRENAAQNIADLLEKMIA